MAADSHKKKTLTNRAPGAKCAAWVLERRQEAQRPPGRLCSPGKESRAEGAWTLAEVEVKLTTDTVKRYGERMRQERVSFWFKALADICKGKQNLQGPALTFPRHVEQANPDLGLLSRSH